MVSTIKSIAPTTTTITHSAPVTPQAEKHRPLCYTTPLVSTLSPEECYESPLWARVRDARNEMAAARASGQTTAGITIEWFCCDICTVMVGPDFHEKDLYLLPVYAERMYLDDYGHDAKWPRWQDDSGAWHDYSDEEGAYYWQPDQVRVVFQVLHVCGTCAMHRELDIHLLVIASGDWKRAFTAQLVTSGPGIFPPHLQEAKRLAEIHVAIKNHVSKQMLVQYSILYAHFLNYLSCIGYTTIPKWWRLPGVAAQLLPPVIALNEHRIRKQQQRQQQSVTPAQVYYSPVGSGPPAYTALPHQHHPTQRRPVLVALAR